MSDAPAPGVARLLVVDDHPIICEGLTSLVNGEPDMRVDWQAYSAQEALRVCDRHAPDLGVVDIMLGEESGLELIGQLHVRRPSMPTLAMSMHHGSDHAAKALEAGARGYIAKHLAPRHIVEAIREVLAGRIYLREEGHAPEGPIVLAGLELLSPREREVFLLIGEGLTKGAIAARLGVSPSTVETHRTSLKHKLRLGSGGELARFAFLRCRGKGLP